LQTAAWEPACSWPPLFRDGITHRKPNLKKWRGPQGKNLALNFFAITVTAIFPQRPKWLQCDSRKAGIPVR
jgi:putative ABC transport system substrate-binding protein